MAGRCACRTAAVSGACGWASIRICKGGCLSLHELLLLLSAVVLSMVLSHTYMVLSISTWSAAEYLCIRFAIHETHKTNTLDDSRNPASRPAFPPQGGFFREAQLRAMPPLHIGRPVRDPPPYPGPPPPLSLIPCTRRAALPFSSALPEPSRHMLPEALAQITALTTLDLHNNQLTGFIPQHLFLHTYIALRLSFNNWTCPLPAASWSDSSDTTCTDPDPSAPLTQLYN
eukprot:gene13018-biopygen8257